MTTEPGRLRIAVTSTPFFGRTVHADCLTALADTAALLESMGHTLSTGGILLGNSQSIMRRNGALLGVSDTRRPGGAVATVEEIRALDQSRRRWR